MNGVRTSKPISTISYNSEDFLCLKLTELLKAHIISFWVVIFHQPEDDERKGHFHVYVEPSKMLQTDELKDMFIEFDGVNEKPLGVLSFDSSKFGPWYLYALHDKDYLALLGQTRKFHYTDGDFIVCDGDEMLQRVQRIDWNKLMPKRGIYDAIDAGLSFGAFFARGGVPIQQINQFRVAWDILKEERTYRNGKPNHELGEQDEQEGKV